MKYGISFHTKQMIKLNELTTGGKTSNFAKHLSLAHPDLFGELKDRQDSKCIIHKFRLNFNFYSRLINAHTVGTESIQTPLNFSLFVILQPFAKII